jgi:hypothetical protein
MIIKNEFLFVGGHFPPKTRNVCHKIIPRIRLSLTHTQHTHTHKTHNTHTHTHTNLCFFWISPPSLFLVPRNNRLIDKREITRSQGRSQDHKIKRSQGRHTPVLLLDFSSQPLPRPPSQSHTHTHTNTTNKQNITSEFWPH